jgi:hypothetical protein
VKGYKHRDVSSRAKKVGSFSKEISSIAQARREVSDVL